MSDNSDYKPIPTTKQEMIDAINELSVICCRVKGPTPWQASDIHRQIGKLQSLAEWLPDVNKTNKEVI